MREKGGDAKMCFLPCTSTVQKCAYVPSDLLVWDDCDLEVTGLGATGSKSGLLLVLLRLSRLLRARLRLETLEALSEGAVANLGWRRLNSGT